MVAVAYKRWSFSRVSIYRALTEKILVVCKHCRLEEDVVYNRDRRTWRFDCNVSCISMRSSENNVPDCCDTTVASSIEDGEGVSGVLLSIARVVPITTAVKWLCCQLLTEIVDDGNSKEDTEVTPDVPCSVIRLELIVATDDESLLDRALEGTTDVDTRTDDVTSTDETNVKGVIVCLFAMPALSTSNGELLMAKVLE